MIVIAIGTNAAAVMMMMMMMMREERRVIKVTAMMVINVHSEAFPCRMVIVS